ncbi:MAG: MFS transporter, partial [Candidatus Thorarchaeota archaeon]
MDTKQKFKYWRKRILFSVWITYAAFYLGRVNMSVAIPGILDEFNITKTEIGFVLTSLFTLYAIGQFVNGQLADKFGARKIITTGLLMSAILNAVFG